MNKQARVFFTLWVCLVFLGGMLALTSTPASADVPAALAPTHEPKGQGSDQKDSRNKDHPKDQSDSKKNEPKDQPDSKKNEPRDQPNSKKSEPNHQPEATESAGASDRARSNDSNHSHWKNDPTRPAQSNSSPAAPTSGSTASAATAGTANEPSGGGDGIVVTGPIATEPACMAYLGYPFDQDNHDYVLLSCNLRKNVQILTLDTGSLPGALPREMNYVSGMRLSLGTNSNSMQAVVGSMQVTFKIPAAAPDMPAFDDPAAYVNAGRLTILEWTGTAWKEAAGARTTTAGYVTVRVKHVGMFVLVQK
jgi:hypothetical protein